MAASVDKAYEVIRDGIVRGVYAQGSHITAQSLAAASGLSRTPVREAMRRLHAEGLIKLIANRGAFVSSWSEGEIHQIYQLRLLLEGFAAEAAAQHATDDQLTELRALAEEMERLVGEAGPDLVDEVADRNNRFHKLIVQASGNLRLQDLLSSIVEVPLVLSTFRRYSLPELRRSMSQHLELVTALEARDGAWSRSVMASHILSAQHTLLASIAESAP
ncbi:HTH-type transcriptional repressor RspR [Alphaproteobacteria bacterium SO-S41]|nr:HTH-type transcriptional repressor RspR [Alphaproteobacteria bacterium SO-S41]